LVTRRSAPDFDRRLGFEVGARDQMNSGAMSRAQVRIGRELSDPFRDAVVARGHVKGSFRPGHKDAGATTTATPGTGHRHSAQRRGRTGGSMLAKAATGILAVLVLAVLAAGAASAKSSDTAPHLASFSGHTIDLSQGWGNARACLVDEAVGLIQCFSDEADLRAAEAQLPDSSATTLSPAASCTAPLRLYADGSYGGRELDFYDRGYWQNLSTWSFDNQTSSYQVGFCAVDLADGANGGGSWYPGNTNAGHGEPSMQSGWSDRISSIYID
jgi:hypothetical protein